MNDQTVTGNCDTTTAASATFSSGDFPESSALPLLSVFDMFRIGIGPSSSHTVGPMRAGLDFSKELAKFSEVFNIAAPASLTIDLYGSLGATGRGHNTDRAVLLGLSGYEPESVSISEVESILPAIAHTGQLELPGGRCVPFDMARDIRFKPDTVLPYHVNALTITARSSDTTQPTACDDNTGLGAERKDGEDGEAATEQSRAIILSRTYYSVGGGFAMMQTNNDLRNPQVMPLPRRQHTDAPETPTPLPPYPFFSGAQLLDQCRSHGLSIAELVRQNEESARSRLEVERYLDTIADSMFDCIDAGCATSGVLPGGLNVPRRAQALFEKLFTRATCGSGTTPDSGWASTPEDPMRAMDWVNLFALAVNEENAAGHRIVTAPTNGAAGVVPAVLGYLVSYCPEAGASLPKGNGPLGCGSADAPLAKIRLGEQHTTHGERNEKEERRRRAVHNFLLAATAIGALIKTNASIAGAEVGCQGEVGSASAMAAAGLAQALGGTPEQVENAAEIAMEHSLGLTCDPVAGLVQIPCIERNAIAAVKAINAARMALWSDGRHHVSFDAVIETMRQTGKDMLSKYKETSAGGLAVNVVEC